MGVSLNIDDILYTFYNILWGRRFINRLSHALHKEACPFQQPGRR